MLKFESDRQHLAALQELSRNPELQNYLKDKSSQTPLEQAIIKWLATLSLVYGVPFVNLVPDERMLPVESIRFFYVDPNWIDSMLDGAMSIVTHGTRDEALQLNYTPNYRGGADQKRIEVRPALFNQKPPADAAVGATMTGFLVRSQVVAGWPGLEVKAYRSEDLKPENEIKPLLRINRLAPDVLLVLIPLIPVVIHISEPAEGLRFGVSAKTARGDQDGTPAADPDSAYLAAPRGLGLAVEGKVHRQAGEQITQDEQMWAQVPLRPGGERILNVARLQDNLCQKLQAARALGPDAANLTPAQFAIQMVRAADRQVYASGLDTRALKTAAPRHSLRQAVDKNRLFKAIFEEQS